MSTYVKLGLIALVAGTLGASLPWAYLDFVMPGSDKTIMYFLQLIPRGALFGGLPSLVLLTINVRSWKKQGKSEKYMVLSCLIKGLLVGIGIGAPIVLISGGM